MTLVLVTSSPWPPASGGYLPGVGRHVPHRRPVQIIAILSYGHPFPWSVPAVCGVAGPECPAAGQLGYSLVALVRLTGVITTAVWCGAPTKAVRHGIRSLSTAAKVFA
jgi:ABC-2 type transport system permease protein